MTEEEGSVRLAATRSDALESVRMARELLPSVIGYLSKKRKMLAQ